MADKLAGGCKAGSTSVSIDVLLTKTSDGTEQTGKLYSDATISYRRQGGSRVAVTPVTLSSATAAYSSGGFVEIDSTNMSGLYRLDVPDGAFAIGADSVTISVKVSGCFVYYERFNLETKGAAEVYTRVDTPLPTAAPATSGGLPTAGTGTNQISLSGGKTTVGTIANDAITAAAVAAAAVQKINAGNLLVVQSGTARIGAIDDYNDRIQLAVAGASTTNAFYLWNILVLTGGTGAGQCRVIIEYFGATQIAVCDRDWVTVPDATTTYAILGICSNWITDNGTVFPETHTGYAGNGVEFLTTGNVHFDGNGYLNVNVVAINDSSSGDNHEVTGLAALGIAYDTLGGVTLQTSERTSIAAAVWDALTVGITTANSVGKRIVDYLTGNAFTRLGAPAGASIAADIAAIDTSGGGGAVYGQDGAIPWVYVVYAVNGTTPLPGIEVWVSSDTAGINRSPATKITDALGRVTFNLDEGVVYVWRRDPRQDVPGSPYYPFTTYDTETVGP